MMTGGRFGANRGDFLRLFDGGSAAGLGEGDLVGRFVDRRDDGAFAILVGRLGPMVWGVCRRMLRDEGDAEDAFQATFLVLARRAGAIRDRDLVATWLHEVAVRVARKARADAARRPGRDRLGAVAEARHDDPRLERAEVRAGIDEEIGRLPESHRRVVILCDVEGLNRDEAAARLGWTANMVRGRLERARARLRDRLSRRGLAPSGVSLALIPPALPAKLASSAFGPGFPLALGHSPATASAVALSEGVIRMMILAKWKFAASALLSAGAVLAGSGYIAAQQGPGDGPASKAAAPGDPISPPDPPKPGLVAPDDPFVPRSIADLARARVEMARARYEVRKAWHKESKFLYKGSKITDSGLFDASKALMDAERDADGTKSGRIAAARAHYRRIKEALEEDIRLGPDGGKVGTVTSAEAKSLLLEAEFILAHEIEASPADVRPATPTTGDGPKPGHESLSGAIADFNGSAFVPLFGRAEPALTEDEVVAAIRYWRPAAIPNGTRPELALPPADLIAKFRAIAEGRRLPPGAWLQVATLADLGEDRLYVGCWVRVAIPRADGHPFYFPIRGRLAGVISLEEMLAHDEATLRGVAGGPILGGDADPADRVKDLRERIRARDEKAGK